MCQPSGPGSIPGLTPLETAITRGNLIMLLPPTTFCVLHAYDDDDANDAVNDNDDANDKLLKITKMMNMINL